MTVHPVKQDSGIEYEIGPKFFESFKNWPGLQWIYQVPLPFGTLENVLELARHGIDAIGIENLYALEIGNEPKSPPFTDVKHYLYVGQWLNYSKMISNRITDLPSEPIYQGLSLGPNASAPWDVYATLWRMSSPVYQ